MATTAPAAPVLETNLPAQPAENEIPVAPNSPEEKIFVEVSVGSAPRPEKQAMTTNTMLSDLTNSAATPPPRYTSPDTDRTTLPEHVRIPMKDTDYPEVISNGELESLDAHAASRGFESHRQMQPRGQGQPQPYSQPQSPSQGPGTIEEMRYASPAPAAQALVTPLHLLGDQPDLIDCPFCRRRAETKVKKPASGKTKTLATVLFLTTFLGTFVPCWCNWYVDVDHHCGNCGKKVTHRKHDQMEPEVLGVPDHLREPSRYEAAEAKKKRGINKSSTSGLNSPVAPETELENFMRAAAVPRTGTNATNDTNGTNGMR